MYNPIQKTIQSIHLSYMNNLKNSNNLISNQLETSNSTLQLCLKNHTKIEDINLSGCEDYCLSKYDNSKVCYNTDCICTMEYDPVCGLDTNGKQVTYSNACMAGCANAEIIDKGECKNECICTKEYHPVCGLDTNGKHVTYGNECMAECANAEIISKGECPTIN